jgi:hypothetical protein
MAIMQDNTQVYDLLKFDGLRTALIIHDRNEKKTHNYDEEC